MMNRAALWSGGAVASLVGHGALVAVLAAAIAPDPPPKARAPDATFDIASYPVPQSTAPETAAESDALREGSAKGTRASGRAVPQSRAAPLPVPGQAAAVVRDATAAIAPVAAPVSQPADVLTAPALAAVTARGDRIAPSVDPDANMVAAARPTAPVAAGVTPDAPPARPAPVAAPVARRPVSPNGLAPRLAGVPLQDGAVIAQDASGGRAALRPAIPVATPASTVAGATAPVIRAAIGTSEIVPVSAPSPGVAIATGPLPTAVQRAAVTPASAKAVEARLTPDRPEDRRPPAAQLAALVSPGAALARSSPAAIAVVETAPATTPTAETAPRSDIAPSLTPPGQRQSAALAWSGGGDAALNDVSLAAIQAFSRADDPTGDGPRVRDAIGALLAQVPCARLQTVFDPDTGRLELRGHIPEDGLRAPVLTALAAQVGPAIPLADTLLILPRPQCGALAGIEDVGLAQSDEQEGDPRVVGARPFAAVSRFVEGDALAFAIQGPDYPAYVYVDYFDADGQVIHLQPNDLVPLRAVAPKDRVAVGLGADGRPAMTITVAPPFGQEIMVTFASSVPLYDGQRPLVEPAAPYLTFLKSAVAAARAATPDFRGEWFYFFVTTRQRP